MFCFVLFKYNPFYFICFQLQFLGEQNEISSSSSHTQKEEFGNWKIVTSDKRVTHSVDIQGTHAVIETTNE